MSTPIGRKSRKCAYTAKNRRGGAPSRSGVDLRPAPRRRKLRAAGAARKGGTPGEGSPFDPFLRFFGIRLVPRAAARGQGRRPWTPPAFL